MGQVALSRLGVVVSTRQVQPWALPHIIKGVTEKIDVFFIKFVILMRSVILLVPFLFRI